MLYTIITILSLLVIALSYAVYNTLKKIEKYEDFIEYELQRNESLLEALRQIDSREMFDKDYEVGYIFYKIKETIEKFKQFK